MKYEVILGLEIHIQLKTDQKMFCTCKNDPFYSEPNTNICPVCLGLPGAMPLPNKEALEQAQRFAFALGSNLNARIIFERKNYFYPDLPKGFQLTCPHSPISTGGEMDMSFYKENLKIKYREIHLEEDTAKSHHEGDFTYIDFNKSGVPLLEVVTEPDFRDIEDGVRFCKEVQLIAQYVGASDADMEKGNMRLEANLSLRKFGDNVLPDYRVELKNINSFNFMKKALEYEVIRQTAALDNGEKLYQETRGYDEKTGKTFIQRSKEEPNDYRYFPEPDIPPISYTQKELDQVVSTVLVTPSKVRVKISELNIPFNYIDLLVSNKEIYEKIKELIEKYNFNPKTATTLCVDTKEYSDKTAKEISDAERNKAGSKITDESALQNTINEIIKTNPKSVEDFKSGKENALQFLIGQVMRQTKGNADPALAKDLLIKSLKNF